MAHEYLPLQDLLCLSVVFQEYGGDCRRQVLYCYSRRPGQGYRRSLNLQQDLHLSLCATGGTEIALPEPSKVTPAGHWWEYLGQRSDLVRPLLLDIAPWLLLGIEMESWCSRTWVPPSVWKCPTLWLSMLAVPGGWRNWYHWLEPNRKPDILHFGSSVATRLILHTVQKLSDALVNIWEGIPQDTIHQVIRCPHVVRHAYKCVGPKQTIEYNFELLQWHLG